jgi:tetratricopeptide (TPR) repeat protein
VVSGEQGTESEVVSRKDSKSMTPSKIPALLLCFGLISLTASISFGNSDRVALDNKIKQAEEASREGRYTESERAYLDALQILQGAFGPEPRIIENIYSSLGMDYINQGNFHDAEHYFRQALLIQKQYNADPRMVAVNLGNLASSLLLQGKLKESEPLIQQSLSIFKEDPKPNPVLKALSIENLARLRYEQGDVSSAERLFKEELDLLESALGPDTPLLTGSLHGLAKLYSREGNLVQAEKYFTRVMEINKGSNAKGYFQNKLQEDYAEFLKRKKPG